MGLLKNIEGYRLNLSRGKSQWKQLSFTDLSPEWPRLTDPILSVQQARLGAEIIELDLHTGIICSIGGVMYQDNGGGTIICVEDEEACIIFPIAYYEPWVEKFRTDMVRVVLTLEDIAGFQTYDPQLGKIIDIRADIGEIDAAYQRTGI